MSRGIGSVIAAMIAALFSLSSPAQAAEPIVDWRALNDVLNLRPAEVVAQAVKGLPLNVTVTRETSEGPVFDTIHASSRADAERIVAAQQKRANVLAVSMEQRYEVTSNDTYRSRQWALNTLQAENVWRYANGSDRVVAVVDTGVWTGHPDLKGQILAGYDVIRGYWGQTDQHGHGTHVAGIIGAVANNWTGVAGLSPNVQILAVKAMDASGYGTTANIAKAISWSVNHGAKVVNLSLSGDYYDAAIDTAVRYAASKNVLVVAAAGNTGCGSDLFGAPAPKATQYPAAYAGVLGVGSINPDLKVSSFSSCGSWVDVAAPGGQIPSTMIMNGKLCPATWTYCTLSGTSMAAAYVSAEAILLNARFGYHGASIANRIIATTTDLGPSGRDIHYGNGLINPLRAVQ